MMMLWLLVHCISVTRAKGSILGPQWPYLTERDNALTQHIYVSGIISYLLSHLIFTTLGSRKYCDAHFTDEESEAQRNLETNPHS